MLVGRLSRTLKAVLAIMTPALMLYVCASPLVLEPLWNGALFKPSSLNEPAPLLVTVDDLPHTELNIPTTNHAMLNAWLFPSANAKNQGVPPHRASTKLAIISHGNAGSIVRLNDMIASFRNAGVAVLSYDYQGYGKSTGRPSIENICTDGLSVYDYAAQKLGFSNRDIILVGESLGCGVTTEVAMRRPCAGLILQAGFASLPKIAKETLPILQIYPDCMFSERFNNASNLTRIDAPVLIVHGTADEIIPFSHALINYAAAGNAKQLFRVEGAAHRSFVAVGGCRYNAALQEFVASLPSADTSLTDHTQPAR